MFIIKSFAQNENEKNLSELRFCRDFSKKKINIMPVNVVVLAEFELEVVVAAVTLVSKLEAVEAAPEATPLQFNEFFFSFF